MNNFNSDDLISVMYSRAPNHDAKAAMIAAITHFNDYLSELRGNINDSRRILVNRMKCKDDEVKIKTAVSFKLVNQKGSNIELYDNAEEALAGICVGDTIDINIDISNTGIVTLTETKESGKVTTTVSLYYKRVKYGMSTLEKY